MLVEEIKEVYESVQEHIKKFSDDISFSSCKDSYFQLSLKATKKIPIGHVHYEIKNSKDGYKFEIHFEEINTTFYKNNTELDRIVINNSSNYEWFTWWAGKKEQYNSDNKSIKYTKEFETLDDLVAIIKNTYDLFNDKIVEIYNNNEHQVYKKKKKGLSMEQNYKSLLEYQKQIILQGPPGTGKTRVAKQIAIAMLKEEDISLEDEPDFRILEIDLQKRVNLIQFHPSYSYEDFVRGIVAKTEDGKDGIKYVVENKILAQMAKDAFEDKENKPYILIVDEINRANLSSVLGELIYALEYRDEAVESMYEIENTEGKSREIILPSNLYIIGTMNTADRSIGNMDYAIRRRFAFVDVLPDSGVVSNGSKFDDVERIFNFTADDFEAKKVQLGHSYFIAKDIKKLDDKLKYQIIPLLEEYVSDGVLKADAADSIKKLKSYIDSKE